MNDYAAPTDSVLRRHAEQLAASRGLLPMPEDSIQRRHYLQRLEALQDARTPEPAPPRVAPQPARPTPRPAQEVRPEPVVATAKPEASSWFGRFLRKLGSR